MTFHFMNRNGVDFQISNTFCIDSGHLSFILITLIRYLKNS